MCSRGGGCVGSERACDEVRGGRERLRGWLALPFSQHPPVLREVIQAQQHPWPARSLSPYYYYYYFFSSLFRQLSEPGDRRRLVFFEGWR